MLANIMESTFNEIDPYAECKTEDEIVERYEKVLEKIRQRLKREKKEKEIKAACLYKGDFGQYRVNFFGPKPFNTSLETLERLL